MASGRTFGDKDMPCIGVETDDHDVELLANSLAREGIGALRRQPTPHTLDLAG
jgi:hypothetical protein